MSSRRCVVCCRASTALTSPASETCKADPHHTPQVGAALSDTRQDLDALVQRIVVIITIAVIIPSAAMAATPTRRDGVCARIFTGKGLS
jgi:hypothetical protein